MKPKELLAVFFGTFLLILLGDGVVANCVLAPKLGGASSYNWNTITLGWAFAVIITTFISGAHNNPAITLAMAIRGELPWSKLAPYLAAEFAGAFLGALGVYFVYRDGLQSLGMPNIWTSGAGTIYNQTMVNGVATVTAAGSFSILTACVAEFFGTMVLMWAVLSTSDSRNAIFNQLAPFVVGGAVLVVGLCLGGPSGYSINPARDLGPRLLGLVVGTKGLFEGLYWLIPPVLIPFISAPVAGWLFDSFFASEKA
jgi:glycerol uptake facilitator protein